MADKAALSYRYSIEGSLKRALFLAGHPLTMSELAAAVKALGRSELSDEDLQARLQAALTTAAGAFEYEDGAWRLRKNGGSELGDLALQFLRQAGHPMKFGDILRHLQSVTRRSRGELMSRVDLDGDPRFARLDSGEWVLTDWPETMGSQNEVAVGTEMAQGEGTTMSGGATEELVTQTVRMIRDQLALLREREQAISREALDCFYQEDLPGIERLMRERRSLTNLIHKLEGVAADLPASEEAAVGTAP
ncbi:MAG: hypothetical protein IMX06_00220 [Kyrpidia tusciae]|nr:hypothetical protein [Kyrpidia tusciae]MBE3551290.1 hypothetical protein [Kyrpidia tusciae]